MTFAQLTEEQLDTLREIGNIGMSHAATALSRLIGETVHLRVPRVTVVDIAQVPELLGGPEKVVAGIVCEILGDARGSILMVFPEDCAQDLISSLLGPSEGPMELNEINTSAFKEVGNILASAFLSALGNLLRINLIPSPPLFAYDMAGAVVDSILIELSREGDLALIVETDFYGNGPVDDIKGKGHFLILSDSESMNVLLKAAGGQR